jgi:CheY-like chemotaxis protein
MSAATAADILIAASDVDHRLAECLSDCRATFVRTFDEAQRALRERLFRLVVIDLNFDNLRMFDLLEHVRSLARFNGVPVLCVQLAEAGAGIGAALDRLVKRLGAKAFVDLRDGGTESLERLCHMVGAELGTQAGDQRERVGARAPLCILIIDHDVDAAQRLGEILEQAGDDVDFAYNGPAGLDAARRLRPDVVFLDLRLPGLDAYQVARRLRQERALRASLVIGLVSAAVDERDRERMREAGFDHHLAKPADRQALRKLLAEVRPQPARHMLG